MKLGTIEHPKTAALAKELDCHLLTAVGLLEALWHFTSRYARDGDVGRFSDEQIAAGVQWQGHHLRLIESLIRTRWLDVDPVHRLVVHDWEDHANNWVQALHSRDRKAVRTQSKDSKDSVLDGKGLSPISDRTTPLPIPSLALPNQALPVKNAARSPRTRRKAAAGPGITWSQETGWQGITEADLLRWKAAYPACHLTRQLAAADAWLRANPAKAVKRAWGRFLTNWFARSQERGGDVASQKPKQREPTGRTGALERIRAERLRVEAERANTGASP